MSISHEHDRLVHSEVTAHPPEREAGRIAANKIAGLAPLVSSLYARNAPRALPNLDILSGDSEQFGDTDGLLISFTSKHKRPAGDAIAAL